MNKKMKIYVLDTSAIFSGISINLTNVELISTQEVKDEIQPGGKDYQNFQFLLQKGLKIIDYSEESLNMVKEISDQTKDIQRLSKTDLSVLALAYDKKIEGNEAIILSDDYSIQNVASFMNIDYKSISQKGIKKKLIWQVRCRGCGKYFKDNLNICPICGSTTKTSVKQSREKKD